MNDHPDYKKGIENGANMLAKEIDRLCIEAIKKSSKLIDKGRFVGKGQLEGTPQDFKDAAETFKNTDIAAACRKINSPREYSEEYDAYYNAVTNEWLEPKCTVSECRYCSNRPERPLPIDDNRTI
jgi:hypothetical protein